MTELREALAALLRAPATLPDYELWHGNLRDAIAWFYDGWVLSDEEVADRLIAAGVVSVKVLTEPRGARLFRLIRSEDVSGTSGVGSVAEGAEFSTGKVVLAWTTEFRSVAVYDSLAEMERIHGHDGRTIVEWSAGVHLGDEELREAAQALVDWYDGPPYIYVEHEMEERIDAIRAALAAQEDPTSVQPPICKAKHTHCWEHRAASRRLAQEGETPT